MLKYEGLSKNNKIDLIWSCKDKDDAIYDNEIKESIKNKKNIRYIKWISVDKGRISAENIMRLLDDEEKITDKLIFICGPNEMMMDLANQFVKMGVKPRNIIFEDFNLI